MSEVAKKVYLYGEMAKRWGKVHTFYVNSSREALSAMLHQFDGLKEYLNNAHSVGLRFQVKQGTDTLVKGEDFERCSAKDMHIKPVIAGGKRAGLGQTILGAVLVAIGIVMTVKGNPYGPSVTAAGVSLMAGGIAQMLVKTPKKADAVDMSSKLFSNITNTTEQGVAIPVGYGRLFIGSSVISASIQSVDYGSPAGANGLDIALGV